MDLGFLRFISAIGTQGAISQETHKIYFVKSYKVDVSSNGEDWITLKEGSKQKVRLKHLLQTPNHMWERFLKNDNGNFLATFQLPIYGFTASHSQLAWLAWLALGNHQSVCAEKKRMALQLKKKKKIELFVTVD